MGKVKKIRDKVLSGGADNSVSFDDLLTLARSLGLTERTGGKHAHIFTGSAKNGSPIFLNLQTGKGHEAKPYQVVQVRRIISEYEL